MRRTSYKSTIRPLKCKRHCRERLSIGRAATKVSISFRGQRCEDRSRAPQAAGQKQSGDRDKTGAAGEDQPERGKAAGAVINDGDELDPDRADTERQQKLGAEGGGPPLGRSVA